MEGPDIVAENNEGVNHPWCKPSPDIPVPDQLVPTPITILVLVDPDKYLEEILWVKFGELAPIRSPPLQLQTLGADDRPRSSLIFNFQGGAENGGVSMDTTNNGLPRNPDQPIQLSAIPGTPVNYYQKSIKELEKLIAEQSINLPDKVKNIRHEEERRKIYAAYLGEHDLEVASRGRSVANIIDFADGPRAVTGDNTITQITERQERVGGVLRQITRTTITRTVISVPSTRLAVEAPAVTSPNRVAVDLHALMNEEVQQLLLSEKLDVTGDRETDIDTYRAWRGRTQGDNQKRPCQNTPEMQVKNAVGGNGESSIIFPTTINITSPRSLLVGSVIERDAQKRSRPEDAPVPVPVLNPPEERQSSPDPESSVANDYSNWTAAALKRNAAARDPPIKVPWKQKAAETVKLPRPKLKNLDEQARVARNEIREAKRARAKTRRDAAKGGERPQKRLKLTVKNDRKRKGNEIEAGERNGEHEAEGGDVEEAAGTRVQGEENLEQVEERQGAETGEAASTPAPEEGGSEAYQEFVVETPVESGDTGDDPMKP
jgi:hypothetical protein